MSRQFFSGLKQTRVNSDTDVSQDPQVRLWTVAQKARVLTDGAPLRGLALTVYLKRLGVSREEYERWHQALKEDSRPSPAVQYRMDRLKRTLKRQQRLLEKAGGLRPATPRRLRRPLPGGPQCPSASSPEAGARASFEGGTRSARKARGRPRKFNPTIPAHIDQTQLPKGIYWDRSGRGRWFVFVTNPQTGERNTKVVAGRSARLSVLRAIVGVWPRDYVRGTVGWVMARFEESTDFAALADSTRTLYRYCAKVAQDYHIHNGRGASLDTLFVDRLRLPVIQRVIETIAKGRAGSVPGAADAQAPYPAKANHLLRYLHRLFEWGRRHGHCQTNPAAGTKRVPLQPRSGMPTRVAYEAVLKFAQTRGALTVASSGALVAGAPARAVPPAGLLPAGAPASYLWALMEIKYLCRMRSIEVLALTDAHASEQGIYVARRKGSNDNIVRWSPRLRAAWDAAVAVRASIRARRSHRLRTLPSPERRFIFVSPDLSRWSAAGSAVHGSS